MQVWWVFRCDEGHRWEFLDEDAADPRPEWLRCPKGHEAVVVQKMAPADRVLVTLVPVARISDSVTGRVSREHRYVVVIASSDGSWRLQSCADFSWTDAIERAGWFENVTWADAQKRWDHSKLGDCES